MSVIDTAPDIVAGLPIDQLGLSILADLVATKEWNEHNYLNAARKGYSGEAHSAIVEAMAWLRSRVLIARDAGQSSNSAIIVTRAGHQVLADGPTVLYATERLQGGTHALIEDIARTQFLIGQFELGVFGAMKAVEVRVRRLGKFGEEDIGVSLMNKAFGPTGPLTDPEAAKGEQEGTRSLFAGAYAVLRNPSGHRDVDYDDVAEAAEAVQTASFLMRILDRVETRRTKLDRELLETVAEHIGWVNSLLADLPDSQAAFEAWRDRAGSCLHQVDILAARVEVVSAPLAQQLRMYETEPVADVAPVWDNEHDGWKRKVKRYGMLLARVEQQLGGAPAPPS